MNSPSLVRARAGERQIVGRLNDISNRDAWIARSSADERWARSSLLPSFEEFNRGTASERRWNKNASPVEASVRLQLDCI